MSLDDSSSEEENMEIYFSTDEELWVLRLGKGVNSSVAALLLSSTPSSPTTAFLFMVQTPL